MCQISTSKKFRKTDKDIVVYKTLRAYDDGRHRSSVMNFSYAINHLYVNEMDEIMHGIHRLSRLKYETNEGFHSYQSYRSAKKRICFDFERVAKCIIPAGSMILKGRHSSENLFNPRTIVSNQIIIKEIM